MAFTSHLPQTRDISWLSTLVPSYPATRRDIVRTARKWNVRSDIIMFLREFDADKQFESRSDFMLQCEQLADEIRREWESPQQTVIL